MTCAQHLIENAIFALVRGREHKKDVNAEYTSCTIEEANEMAMHIVYSLYDGAEPGEAVDVIRCKDCKHYRVYDDPVPAFCDLHNGMQVDDDDFCSYGSNKDNG